MTNVSKPTPFQSANGSLFISLEGIEGSGKSTQIQLIKDYLSSLGYQVLILREPGGTKFGEGLRSAILESEEPLHPLAEAYLFASSRSQLLKEKILPFLEKDKSIVILDRYIDSSIAYQGKARGLGIETIINIHSYSPLNIMPNLTFLLDIDLKTSMERQSARGNDKDYFEKENQNFYQNLIDGYHECAKTFPERMKVIAAERSVEEVFSEVKSILDLSL